MGRFIKSHSNYVLKSKHQAIKDGTIWERDITTIGALNQFSPGQMPIYQTSNFIISVRGDSKVTNQYNSTSWNENGNSGTVWTLDAIEGLVSENERQDDTKIVLKQDYYDLRDFAYYGSLTELFRASVTDIIRRFPGELYCTDNPIYYTHKEIESGERVEYSERLGGEDLTEVSNPFSINMHSLYKPKDEENPLKYFANGGYKNYRLIVGDNDNCGTIYDWESRVFTVTIKKREILDGKFGGTNGYGITNDYFYKDYMRPIIELLRSKDESEDDEIWWSENHNDVISGYSYDENGEKKSNMEGWDSLCAAISEECKKYTDTRFHIYHLTGETEGWEDLTPDTEGDASGFSSSWQASDKIEELCPEPKRDDYSTYDEYQTAHDEWEVEISKYVIYEYNPCCAIDCYFKDCFSKGEKAGSITAKTSCGDSECNCSDLIINGEGGEGVETDVVIGVWIGEDNDVFYLAEGKYVDVHIRPIEKFIDKFYNECDNFEYLLMNPNSSPLYVAVFSVIRENEFGYYRELETFEFPKTYGGYNIDVSEYGFNGYTDKMVEIGEYYDEYFSDNLYRSMTHEALKNFDWTYTKEYNPGEEEEYVVGGERFKKAMRIFAREFDEALSYINAITSSNIVTYDQRNNIPDYFLIDTVENEGWDVKLVIPYTLSEYYYDENGLKQEVAEYVEGGSCEGQLGNEYNGKHIAREFSQNSAATVKPYTKDRLGEFADGWFIVCPQDDGETPDCKYCGDGINYKYMPANGETRYYDTNALSKKGSVKNRIKPFTDEREYTYLDVNNEFLRRLKLNSRDIWRHKGTVDGIEMILGMFGLKSKRWCDALYEGCCPENRPLPDYEINEYTSFAHRIEEPWDAVHQRYRTEWLNSTKTITYDNRFVSDYNRYGRNDRIYPYQGIPVSFRDEYEYPTTGIASGCSHDDGYKPYIKMAPLEEQVDNGVVGTSDISEAFKYIGDNNAPVLRRYLYPSFDKYEQLDGNPYFQMDGGWHSNVVQDSSGNVYNFQYDVDNNIVFTEYNYDSSGNTLFDNERLYKETIRNIRTFDSVADLLRIHGVEAFDGMVCHVASIESDSIVINDVVYPIKREYYRGNDAEDGVYSYVSLIKEGGSIRIGDDRYFDTTLIVYDRNGQEAQYDISSKPVGYEVKAYILKDGNGNYRFICKETDEGYYSIDSYQVLDGDTDENLTHYFKLTDSSYYNRLANGELVSEDENGRRYNWTEGWRRLDKTDKEYLKINTIHNYYEGNNPHNGNMRYDSGHEYFTYFKRIFKHAHDNDLFDERCYEDYFDTYDTEIPYIGFSGLIEDNEDVLQYDKFLNPDTKIHFFGNYLKKDEETNTYTRYIYGENCERFENFKKFYSDDTTDDMEMYILSASTDEGWIEEFNPYSPVDSLCPTVSAGTIDEVTNQIMNNKRFELIFYLHEEWYTKEGQEELKYLDDIVANYLTQLVPSTVIYSVKYMNRQKMTRKVTYQWDGGTGDASCDDNGNTMVTVTGTKTIEYEDINDN